MPETHRRAAGEQIAEPAFFLFRGAVFGKGADRAKIAELHHVGTARAFGGDLLDGDHRVHQRSALAALLGWQRDAHEARSAINCATSNGNPASCARFKAPAASFPAQSAAPVRQTASALR